tara:strand:+ start:219 stop:656 length:438 start_codon:yes stop_codon:yes gene_type:complete
MPRMVFFLLIILLSSCIENAQTENSTQREVLAFESFEGFINNKSLNTKNDIDFNQDRSLINQDYPMEFWLYKNNKYYYDLPKLGDGIGEWSYENGALVLENDHHIKTIDLKIQMDYQVYFTSEQNIYIEFSDRFGLKEIELEFKD